MNFQNLNKKELVYLKAYSSILVAVDGSKESERAFEKAVQIAKKDGAKLHIAHVVDVPNITAIGRYTSYSTGDAIKYGKKILDEFSEKSKELGFEDVNIILEHGSPKRDIPTKISEDNKIDLIVCGATGVNAVERFLIGSVSEQIVRLANCDVLVVRNA